MTIKPYRHLPKYLRKKVAKVARENFWCRISFDFTPEQTFEIDRALHDAALIAAAVIYNQEPAS